MKDDIICIVGPTASGKTGLSIKLAKALDAKIISADSMQIYRGLDIGTSKVTKEEMEDIEHYMIDICDVKEKFSVADFKKMCYDYIEQIKKEGKTPIIVGGTGLYINAICDDMDFKEENIDEEYRKKIYDIAAQEGNEAVYNLLVNIDPDSAKNIHPNNLKRVIRALEIANNSHILKSKHMENEAQRKKTQGRYSFKVYYIDMPRDILYERINKRVDIMVNEGLLEETKKLYDMKLPLNVTCMQAIGYKELFPYFENKITLQEAIEELKKSTRKYGKRQETWFKNKLNIQRLDGLKDKSELVEEILKNKE